MRNPFETQALVDWLEKQPENTTYNYSANCNCCIAQYFRSVGFSGVIVGATMISLNNRWHDMPTGWNRVAVSSPYIFGAALKRARALLEMEKA